VEFDLPRSTAIKAVCLAGLWPASSCYWPVTRTRWWLPAVSGPVLCPKNNWWLAGLLGMLRLPRRPWLRGSGPTGFPGMAEPELAGSGVGSLPAAAVAVFPLDPASGLGPIPKSIHGIGIPAWSPLGHTGAMPAPIRVGWTGPSFQVQLRFPGLDLRLALLTRIRTEYKLYAAAMLSMFCERRPTRCCKARCAMSWWYFRLHRSRAFDEAPGWMGGSLRVLVLLNGVLLWKFLSGVW